MKDFLKLDDQLCFPVYALSRQISTIYRPHLEKLGLTYPKYLVMLVLWEHRSVTVKDLGQLLWLDSGTLTPLLKKMELEGLLIRKRSSRDERMVDITISSKGLELKHKALSIPCYLKNKLEIGDNTLEELKKQLNSILEISKKTNKDTELK